jgi:chromosome segregation ATPase
MITKTYLDGKLNQLEEKIKRTIDVKDNRQTEELSAEIKKLKIAVKILEEKVAENRDVIENYLKERNNPKDNAEEFKSDTEELHQSLKNFQEVGIANDIKKKDNDNDIITSDF